jgi:hypothetical protein
MRWLEALSAGYHQHRRFCVLRLLPPLLLATTLAATPLLLLLLLLCLLVNLLSIRARRRSR